MRAGNWNSKGSVRVLGDAEAASATLAGVVSIGGALAAGRLATQGTLDVFGTTRISDSAEVDGTTRFHGAVTTRSLRGTGRVEIGGDLSASTSLEIQGILVVRGNSNIDRLEFDGTLDLRGPLLASKVVGRLRGASSAASIQAQTVSLRSARSRRPKIPFLPPRQEPMLVVARLEAKEAYLENVRAERVRVDRLTVGPGCHLTEVIGTVVARHKDAHIGPEAEVPLPYGLTP